MEELGIEVFFFIFDGVWEEVLDVGMLIEEDVFVIGNFGSYLKENVVVLKKFMICYGKKWLLMCMEYWDGWFNCWGELVI